MVDEIMVMMAPGHLDAVRAHGAQRRLRQGHPGPRGRRHPQRHDPARARSTSPTTARCSSTTRCARWSASGSSPSASRRSSTYDAVDVAIPSADTIIEVDPADNTIRAIPQRANLRRGQTPQAFRASVLRAAYDVAGEDPDFTATDDCGVVLRYLPDVPIWVVSGEERNMKVTDPIDVFLADKLFQLTSSYVPEGHSPEEYRAALDGKVVVVLGGSYGIGADIAALAGEYGATVVLVQPVEHRHPRRASRRPRGGRRAGSRGARPDRLRGRHRRHPAARLAARDHRGDDLRRDRGQLPRPGLHRPGLLPPPAPHRAAACCCSPPAATPAAAAATASTPRPRPRWSTSPRRWPTSGPRAASGSTASTPSAPARRCAPRRSARSRPTRCSTRGSVAKSSIDVLLSDGTGHVLDLRKLDPLAESGRGTSANVASPTGRLEPARRRAIA